MNHRDAIRIVRARGTVPTGYTTLGAAADVLIAEIERQDAIVERLFHEVDAKTKQLQRELTECERSRHVYSNDAAKYSARNGVLEDDLEEAESTIRRLEAKSRGRAATIRRLLAELDEVSELYVELSDYCDECIHPAEDLAMKYDE